MENHYIILHHRVTRSNPHQEPSSESHSKQLRESKLCRIQNTITSHRLIRMNENNYHTCRWPSPMNSFNRCDFTLDQSTGYYYYHVYLDKDITALQRITVKVSYYVMGLLKAVGYWISLKQGNCFHDFIYHAEMKTLHFFVELFSKLFLHYPTGVTAKKITINPLIDLPKLNTTKLFNQIPDKVSHASKITGAFVADKSLLALEEQEFFKQTDLFIIHSPGGGFAFGSPETHKPTSGGLALATINGMPIKKKVAVFIYQYRHMGTNHKWFDSILDALDSYRYLCQKIAKYKNIPLAEVGNYIQISGDSAGGWICSVLLTYLTKCNYPLPHRIYLMSALLNPYKITTFLKQFNDPLIPLNKNLEISLKRFFKGFNQKDGLPNMLLLMKKNRIPCYIQYGDKEVFHLEINEVFNLAQKTNLSSDLLQAILFQDGTHAFQNTSTNPNSVNSLRHMRKIIQSKL